MSQHDMIISNDSRTLVRADINAALQALVSLNYGPTEPATPYAYMFWGDTTTGLLKIRNAANTAWITVGTLGAANLGLALVGGSASQAFSTAALTTAGLVDISGASAGQVKFPATQNASSDANTLDDYDEYTAASAACTGAVTATVVWKLVKVGKFVCLTLPDTFSAGVAQTNFVYGTVIPAKYRPTTNHINKPATITDNAVNQAVRGEVVVLTTGSIVVYKEPTGATNFTATANAGMGACSVSWMI